MEKNGDSGVCEKIYKAVAVSPFKAIRRISNGSGSWPASPAPNSSLPTPPAETIDIIESKPGPAKPPKSTEAADVVPISLGYSIQAPSNEKQKPKVASKAKPEEARPTHQTPGQVNQTNPNVKAHQFDIEDKVTEFINRVGIKLRSMSHVGDQKKAPRKDKFTDFIDHAGAKIRTTSGIGGGRSNT